MLRTMAQLEEDLNQAHWRLDHARNRLAELDAEVSKLKAILIEVAIEKRAESNLLPPCPTCGGTGTIATASTAPDPYGYITGVLIPCPDCVDGKVTVAQMAATYARVWDPTLDSDPQYPSSGKLAIVGQLRGVR